MKDIIKFYSTTCGPCKAMGNILKQLEGVNIIEADIEDENTQELMAKYKVRTIPTIVIKNSESEEAEHTLTGVHSLEEIKSLLS